MKFCYNAKEYEKRINGVRGDLREFHVTGNLVVVYKKYDDGVELIELLHGGTHKSVLHTSIDVN